MPELIRVTAYDESRRAVRQKWIASREWGAWLVSLPAGWHGEWF